MRLFMVILVCISALPVNAEDFVWNSFRYEQSVYRSQRALEIADNIVKFQRPSGGWSKRIDPTKHYTKEELNKLNEREAEIVAFLDRPDAKKYSHDVSSLDNGATHSQIRFLLRVAEATGRDFYKKASIRGIEYLINAQYPNGGWPQNYPNTSSYGGYVTLNDGAMPGAMRALRDAAEGGYSFIDSELIKRINAAWNKGVDYFLRAQIVVKGKKTAWAQQYDLAGKPTTGRIYEIPAITPCESVRVLLELMSIDGPSSEVKEAITSAVEWFDLVKIPDAELQDVYDSNMPSSISMTIQENPLTDSYQTINFHGKERDRKLVIKKGARPIWARFYDLQSMKPVFSDWSGVKKYSLDKIDYERRMKYTWYGYWPESLLKKDYANWKKRVEKRLPIAPKLFSK